jgi:hypothetical protein
LESELLELRTEAAALRAEVSQLGQQYQSLWDLVGRRADRASPYELIYDYE